MAPLYCLLADHQRDDMVDLRCCDLGRTVCVSALVATQMVGVAARRYFRKLCSALRYLCNGLSLPSLHDKC